MSGFSRFLVTGVAAAILGFLVLPILAVIPASFNHPSYIRLPPEAMSLRWYHAFLADRQWLTALWTSTQVAVATTIASLLLGTTAALGLERLGPTMRGALTGLFLAPLIVPVIVMAVALYAMGRRYGLVGTPASLVAAHTLLCVPFVIINVSVSLSTLDRQLLRAAESLGAGPWRVFRTVTLPGIAPGLFGGAVFAFITSFDEVVISLFLTGVQSKTLPVKMWEVIRLEFTPVVAVASCVMLAITLALFACAQLLQRGASPVSAVMRDREVSSKQGG